MDIAPDKAKEQLGGIGDTARRGLRGCPTFGKKLKPDAVRANVNVNECDSSDDRGYVKGHEHENLTLFLIWKNLNLRQMRRKSFTVLYRRARPTLFATERQQKSGFVLAKKMRS